MANKPTTITFLGAGSIGTALGNALAIRDDLNVRLLSVEEQVVETISKEHINQKYFPNIRLRQQLIATTNTHILADSDIVFLAVPSVAVVPYLLDLKNLLPSHTILVNLAKGFGCEKRTITDCLSVHFPNPVCSLKGPSFAREIINNMPTALTLASSSADALRQVEKLFESTTIYTDQSNDIQGVEILSILKNIYSIIIGIVDAHFNSPNLRFFIFTKAFNEMRTIMLHFGGQEETLFRYCGIGDFGLTALNDMSRNHTLGLLIGKGFFTEDISGKVVLEGRIAMDVFLEKLRNDGFEPSNYALMNELSKIFNGNYDISSFVTNIIS